MRETSKRCTLYLDAEIHEALRQKADSIHCSISDLVNDAVRQALIEDLEDLAIFDERATEPTMSYEELLNDLKANGKL